MKITKLFIDILLSSVLANDTEKFPENIKQQCISFINSLDKEFVHELLKDSKTKGRVGDIAALGMTTFIQNFHDHLDMKGKDEMENTPLHRAITERRFGTLEKLITLLEKELPNSELKALLNSQTNKRRPHYSLL